MLRTLSEMKFTITFLTSKNNIWTDTATASPDEVISTLESHDVAINWNMEVVDIIDLDGESCRVAVENGDTFDTQIVLYSDIYVPNTDFVPDTLVNLDRGILVNEKFETTHPNIYACGDVAQVMDDSGGISAINFGWNSACLQGKTAGLSICGKDVPPLDDFDAYFNNFFGDGILDRWIK